MLSAALVLLAALAPGVVLADDARAGFDANTLLRAERLWSPKVVKLQLSKINYWDAKGAGLAPEVRFGPAEKTAALEAKMRKCQTCSARKLGCRGYYCTGATAFGDAFATKALRIQSLHERRR
jgi:hypothetical protein